MSQKELTATGKLELPARPTVIRRARWMTGMVGFVVIALHLALMIAVQIERPPTRQGGIGAERSTVSFIEVAIPEISVAPAPKPSLASLEPAPLELPTPALPQIEDVAQAAEQNPRQPAQFSPPRTAGGGAENLAQFAESAALSPGQMARVILRVEVLRDGSAGEVKVDTTSGSDAADDAAIRYVRSLEWIPATQGGEPVTMMVRFPVVFIGAR
jgi:TonB family protein